MEIMEINPEIIWQIQFHQGYQNIEEYLGHRN